MTMIARINLMKVSLVVAMVIILLIMTISVNIKVKTLEKNPKPLKKV